ncbi:MAG: RNA polymerase sigma factor [Firmicutes bacterium]|nr:RNA polymerase sigma factor [Bacillota bacterium]
MWSLDVEPTGKGGKGTKQQNEELFSQFIQEHGDKALRYAFVTLHSHQDAEDITQEAFFKLWRFIGRRGIENLSPALLFHTITNLCRDRMRYHQRHPEDPSDLIETSSVSLDEIPALSDDMLVLDAVMQLNIGERQCVTLFYYLDYSLKDTAHALGVNDQVVKTRLYRARQHLKTILAPMMKEGSL